MRTVAPTPPLRIHFVCTANICRSAYCQARAPHFLDPERFVASSSGIQAVEGTPMWSGMRHELELRQPGRPDHTAHQIDLDELEDADLILTMTAEQRDVITGWWPQIILRTFTLPQFVAIASRLTWDEPAMDPRVVIDRAFSSRALVTQPEDVADPYRQGRAQVRACADRLDAELENLACMLTAVVPRRAAE